MSHLIVHGGTPLSGRITPSANKNAVLPILCATLLTHYLAERVRANPRASRWLEKVAGVFLLGFGLRLAFSK